MKSFLTVLLLVSLCVIVVSAGRVGTFALDERWICGVKKTCLDCLRLSHCSWCPTENKCFSQKLSLFRDFCEFDKIIHESYGLSLEKNAECACASGEMEQHCYPLGATDALECSGRGSCICGRCVCDPTPDFEHPTKMVMGEYCEYDNFSCDDPKCNEGPYSLGQPRSLDEDSYLKNNDSLLDVEEVMFNKK